MSMLDRLAPYFVDHPRPLIGAETIQLLLLREILDYTVLRTEETRELNSANTPLSEQDRQPAKRVAFFGGKQKAAESRQLEMLLRSATRNAGMTDVKACYLKDNLCLSCPRCGLHGATSLGPQPNIKHRIEYSTAFSLTPFDQITTDITFNAISDLKITTGQALGTRYAVLPASVFPSIVSLKAVTREEFILAVKTLLACKSYGAESRTGGDVRNTFFGVVAGWEELITPLEFTLELYDIKDEIQPQFNKVLLDKYKSLAANPDQITILPPDEVDSLVKDCANVSLDRPFLEKAYRDIAQYREDQGA